MIDKIIVKNTASYQNDAGQMLAPKEVNFVFGLNGSGKTTISRLIASPSSVKFSDCHISWKGSPLKCLVYNQDFVKKNFSETVPGIFTLGESAIETKNKINDLTTEIENLRKTIDQKNKEIDDSEDENSYRPRLRKLEEIYTNKFWQIKKKLDEENSCILRAITGVLGSKERFKEKLLLENATNKADLLDQDQLESLSTHLLVSSVEKKELITIPNCEELLAIEGDDIFKTAIVGKENVAISELLHKLGNSSWFSQGIQYLDFSEGLCPFCQQKLPDNFNQQIEDYFDKTYENNIKKILQYDDENK